MTEPSQTSRREQAQPLVPTDARIFLAGHTGLVGGSIYRTLQAQGFTNIIVRTMHELDLTDAAATRRFFDEERPQAVIDAAAKVGGIMANWELPWEFVEQNLLIELNLIGEAFRHEVQRLIFLGSSCIYPREAPQPLKEEYLLTGPLEETNRAYAIAKIGGIELCRSLNREYGTDYLSLMPTNLYGPGDNFDLQSSHVLPAMIRKFHDAKVARGGGEAGPAAGEAGVTLWGTGSPRREFLYVDDVGRAITFCLQNVHAADVPDGLLNVGCGEDLTIRELAGIVQRAVGYEGPVTWDDSKPDGTPRKLMDVGRLRSLGWAPEVGLEEGIARTYEWFLANKA
jgi:GDP-L-fucose synthase